LQTFRDLCGICKAAQAMAAESDRVWMREAIAVAKGEGRSGLVTSTLQLIWVRFSQKEIGKWKK